MKKKINIDIDAPVTITFVIVSVLLFLIDSFITKGKWTLAFMSSPTNAGDLAFSFSKVSSYFRLLCYSFSAASWDILITNLLFILLLGPAMEERYGIVVIGIMMAVSTLFAGVLNSCFCAESMKGCTAIVFMMIFLNSFMSFSKKKIPLSFVLIFVLFIVREVFVKNPNGVVGIFIGIAGGLCGSLFAFLVSPKAKSARKSDKAAAGEGLLSKADRLAEIDASSPRNAKKPKLFSKKSKKVNEDEIEEIGTLEF